MSSPCLGSHELPAFPATVITCRCFRMDLERLPVSVHSVVFGAMIFTTLTRPGIVPIDLHFPPHSIMESTTEREARSTIEHQSDRYLLQYRESFWGNDSSSSHLPSDSKTDPKFLRQQLQQRHSISGSHNIPKACQYTDLKSRHHAPLSITNQDPAKRHAIPCTK